MNTIELIAISVSYQPAFALATSFYFTLDITETGVFTVGPCCGLSTLVV
jgi:hypothetical protein